MARLHDALDEAIDELVGDGAQITTNARELHELVVKNAGLNTSIADVDMAVRQMFREGRLRGLVGGSHEDMIIHPSARPSARRGPSQVTVHGGNVQVGDHNRQAITYGNVLQTLIEQVERSDMPPKEKSDLKAHLIAVLKHPLTQTLINGAIALGAHHLP